jgi:ATP-dependent DNA helicase HFM1/MER3
MTYADRRAVEELFCAGLLLVVCTTSTLAQGVNLPARLVVIKSTSAYTAGKGFDEISELMLLQMIGAIPLLLVAVAGA